MNLVKIPQFEPSIRREQGLAVTTILYLRNLLCIVQCLKSLIKSLRFIDIQTIECFDINKIHGAPSSSQIANVDFNTLRKLNTNTSFSSNLTNSTTLKQAMLYPGYSLEISHHLTFQFIPLQAMMIAHQRHSRESTSPSESSKSVSGNKLRIAKS